LFDFEESSGRAGFVAGAGAGFHWMSLKKQRDRQETERDLEGIVKELMITASDEHRRGFLLPHRQRGACCHCSPSSSWGY
jgi:hypothetical protein